MRAWAIMLALLLLPVTSSAQTKKVIAVVDTVQVPFINGIAIHADASGALQRQMSDHGQYEAGMRLNLKDRYFPAVEIGIGHADEKEAYNGESWFKTTAPYMRIGCDFNILRNKHDIYKLFAGFRYAVSHFNYDISVGEPLSEEDATLVYNAYNDLGATYQWIEGVFGTDAKVWGPFHLGWDVRYKRKLTGKHDGPARPWYIPGMGNYKQAGFSANFNVIISF